MERYYTHRRTRRLDGYDYTEAGWYFVTICTKGRRAHFGEIRNGIIGLSEAGCIAHSCWMGIPDHIPRACLDAFIVMPNHVHGLIGLSPSTPHAPSPSTPLPHPGSLSAVVGSYKSAVTRAVRGSGVTSFAWQPRFYDHIVRNDRSFNRIRAYIENNPAGWTADRHFMNRP